MRALVVGAGAVGARVARQLHGPATEALRVVDVDERRAEEVVASLGPPAVASEWEPGGATAHEVVVLTLPRGHRPLAEAALDAGAHVVSVTDDVAEARSLLDLDAEARERGVHLVVGAGFSPGLTCVLARHAAQDFSEVDEIHVAKTGTGGPACAGQHHRALAGEALDWRDGAWMARRGGSGRELCWFPDPIGGLDCYRAAMPDPVLLVSAFPGVQRVTARVSATRRDRALARLPMLVPPRGEAAVGGVRVEVRGRRGTATDTRVLGAIDRPAVAAGAVAATAAEWAVLGKLDRFGAASLAKLVGDPVPFLHDLARRGVKAAVFEGDAAPRAS